MRSEKIELIAIALIKFQSSCPPIKKTKRGGGGSRVYMYAPIEEILATVTPVLKACDLVAVQSTQPLGNGFVLNTILMHVSGQWIDSNYPLDVEGTEQEKGSSQTYSRRYSLCGILGIASEDDDDGQSAADKKSPYLKPKDRPVGHIDPGHPALNGDGFIIDKGYVVPFGKFSQRSLEEIDSKQLGDYVNYLERTAEKKGEILKGVVLDFVERAVEYLGALENNGYDPRPEDLRI